MEESNTTNYTSSSINGSVSDVATSKVDFSQHSVFTIVFLSIVYAILSLSAFTGNSLVIWIITTGRRMNTVINLYIGNLALADVIIAIFCIPFQFQAALLHRWDLPSFLCKLCPFVQHVSINASIYTLVVISLDRYRGIMWPLKGEYSKFKAKLVLVLVWLVSIGLAVPNLIVFYVGPHPNKRPGEYGCLTDHSWISGEMWNNYMMLTVLLQYLGPLFVISITYGLIAKVTKMLCIVVFLFGFCWLPYQVFYLLVFLKYQLRFRGINYIWMASHVLAMSNSCCNPIVYGIYNDKFRKEFNRKLGLFLGRSLPGDQVNTIGLNRNPKASVRVNTDHQGPAILSVNESCRHMDEMVLIERDRNVFIDEHSIFIQNNAEANGSAVYDLDKQQTVVLNVPEDTALFFTSRKNGRPTQVGIDDTTFTLLDKK